MDYLLLYRSGNNGIPIMKWISLGSQWTSMHASRDPTTTIPAVSYRSPAAEQDVHRDGPPSLVHLSDQPHPRPQQRPVSQRLTRSPDFSRSPRYCLSLFAIRGFLCSRKMKSVRSIR